MTGAVEKLESKKPTGVGIDNAPTSESPPETGGFFSGDIGVTARLSFRLNSPWRAIGSWVKKMVA
jgi:hypothetical protein